MLTIKQHNIQMVLLDLDGTLLNNEKKIGDLDLLTLRNLGASGVVRVFATGRSLYSANKVLQNDTPFDYLIFSSGAGILDWKSKEILFFSGIPRVKVIEIEDILRNLKLNFSIQFPIPENHKYFYLHGNTVNSDFEHRNSLYSEYNSKLSGNYPFDSASQFLIILENENQIPGIVERIDGLKAIRATSPIDGKTIWLEIFNHDVSKAKGGEFLCETLGISSKKTLAIGNDYNDIDLLDWVSHSFIVSNAPDELKLRYCQCSSNQNNPLSGVFMLF